MNSDQLDLWRSKFGIDYAYRSENSISFENQKRLLLDWGKVLKSANIAFPHSALEVGCNIGRNLIALRQLIPELHGIEPNEQVVKIAEKNSALSGVDLQVGSAFELPFADASVDLVFTSGVLIHIAPDDLPRAIKEIHRVSRRYIACIEYFSHELTEVKYRGHDGALFKQDFGKLYLQSFPDLRVVDYGFLWEPVDSGDDMNWWLFEKK